MARIDDDGPVAPHVRRGIARGKSARNAQREIAGALGAVALRLRARLL